MLYRVAVEQLPDPVFWLLLKYSSSPRPNRVLEIWAAFSTGEVGFCSGDYSLEDFSLNTEIK